MQIVWDSVHSGSGRTALADNNTDYYPVPLSADTLRPGTVYADPYGHILMIVITSSVLIWLENRLTMAAKAALSAAR